MEEAACKEYSVMSTVFSFLPIKEIGLSASMVCKFWHQISEEPMLWQTLVERDFPHYQQLISCNDTTDISWKIIWQRLQFARFDPAQVHPDLVLSADQTTLTCSQHMMSTSTCIWRGAKTTSTINCDDDSDRVHYCEFVIEDVKVGNIAVGVIKSSVDVAKASGSVWGVSEYDQWSLLAHNSTPAYGQDADPPDTWIDAGSNKLKDGDRVGVLVDARRDRVDAPDGGGADLYFAINGDLRPVAYRGLKGPLSFFCMMSDANHGGRVSVVHNKSPPTSAFYF